MPKDLHKTNSLSEAETQDYIIDQFKKLQSELGQVNSRGKYELERRIFLMDQHRDLHKFSGTAYKKYTGERTAEIEKMTDSLQRKLARTGLNLSVICPTFHPFYTSIMFPDPTPFLGVCKAGKERRPDSDCAIPQCIITVRRDK